MHAVDLVNRDMVAVARATAERTGSPYFGQALLANRLQPLRGRIERLAQVNPGDLAALAEHLDVPPTVPEVLADVENTAQRLLAAFQAPRGPSPEFQLLPVERP